MGLFYLAVFWILFLLTFLPGQVLHNILSVRQRVDLKSALQIPRFRRSLVIVSMLGSFLITVCLIDLGAESYLAINSLMVFTNPHEYWGGPTYGPQVDNIGISPGDWANARRQPYEAVRPIAKQEVIARIVLGENRGHTCFTGNPEACGLVEMFGGVNVNRASGFGIFLEVFLIYFSFLIIITLLQLSRQGVDDRWGN